MSKKKNRKRKQTKITEIRNGWIIYTLTADGGSDYLTYNEVLLEILNSNLLKPFRHDRRLEFKVGYSIPYKIHWYLSDLAYACYHGYVTSLKNCIQEMQRYFEEKGDLQTEHMDNNTYNNTKYNLLWMSQELNGKKGMKVTKIQQPNYLISANCDGECRIQFNAVLDAGRATEILRSVGLGRAVYSEKNFVQIRYICKDAENYVQAIDSIIDELAPKYANRLKDEKNKWIPTDGYIFYNTEFSILSQEYIASLDRMEFAPIRIAG